MTRTRGSRNWSTYKLWGQILELKDDYERMTVRQAFYQLVARGQIDKTEAAYSRVQRNIVNMRRQGVLDWAFIADFTRYRRQRESWLNTRAYIEHCKNGYHRDPWQKQDEQVEIWLEKEALGALVHEVTKGYDVPLMVSRGLSSVTYLYEAGQQALSIGKPLHVYTLYDMDKSGDTAHNKITEGLFEYTEDLPVTIHRLALRADQVRKLNLPTRPGKQGETRAAELDAIPPDILQDLVRLAIERHIDQKSWDRQKRLDRKGQALLQDLEAPTPQNPKEDV